MLARGGDQQEACQLKYADAGNAFLDHYFFPFGLEICLKHRYLLDSEREILRSIPRSVITIESRNTMAAAFHGTYGT